MYHQLLNNQSIELSSSSEIDNITQEGEVIFKKNLTVGLPEVSRLINLAISKERKNSFFEKKILHKRRNGFTMNTQKHQIT